jgi:hypothetical protein
MLPRLSRLKVEMITNMNLNTNNSKNHIPLAVLLIAVLMIMQGCVIFLTGVATIVMMRGSNHFTTTVLIKKDPTSVFTAAVRILEGKSDIKVNHIQEENYLIEAIIGESRATIKATDYGSGLTLLIFTTDTGNGDPSVEVAALKVVRLICEELGVDYKVVE